MKEIRLTKGKVALVDDRDFEELSEYKWHYHGDGDGLKFYAARNKRIENGRYKIRMHSQIMGLEKGSKLQVDHVDGNTLNNCRSNLRVVTNQQNQRNTKKHIKKSSEYKGIYYNRERQKWYARIMVDSKYIWLGSFLCELEAAKAYNEAATKHFGEYANLNTINENN